MSEHKVFVDAGRHTFLEFRDTGKVKHYVSMLDGTIDIIQMTPAEQKQLKPCASTPEHFAKTYLNSFLEVSRSAKAILKGILGTHSDIPENPSAPRFTEGTVSLEQICEVSRWEPSRARKHLRKLVEKPGGRWAWSPEEAEKITTLLKECFASE